MKKNDQPEIFRHELKFFISEFEKTMIEKQLQVVLFSDLHAENGVYTIRSLYFDDLWENAYTEKMAGVDSRKKYRIRIYNFEDQIIKLECKRKERQYINKRSATLNREEVDQILSGSYEFLKEKDNLLCKEFYLELKASLMRPKVIVDYEREPYVYPYGNVRITFDSRVRAGTFSDRLFDAAIPVFEVLEPNQLIMEVKFTEYLPELIRQLLPTRDNAYTAASKYTMCLEKKKELLKV